ncbi:MAG: aminoacyl-tRNA hydrolase [Pseudomonadota bacterium]|nr:aminoacyl-tRNA hydrolase [Pseudomonadota bacterium]HJO35283.1 aminoacyl-tRNA hydrolase [Gammaproteobacteria bacterium]
MASGQAGVGAIVGLGNPGAEYAATRHNAGYWWVDRLAGRHGLQWREDRKLRVAVATWSVPGIGPIRLARPTGFMNHSGGPVAALVRYFDIAPARLLVVHDDLDLPPGTVRLKQGGGHGGHNGLRDIHRHLGPDYLRLRLGVGHPGQREAVVGYVLARPPADEAAAIEAAIDRSLACTDWLLRGEFERAMQQLHTQAS